MDEVEFSIQTLERIGAYMLEGLSEDEACLMIGFPSKNLHIIMESDETVREYIERKKVEFKYNHIKTINDKKSDKNSMYLLEKLRPTEFGSSKKSGDTTVNIISAILKDIQNGSDQQSIIRAEVVSESNKRDQTPRIVHEALK